MTRREEKIRRRVQKAKLEQQEQRQREQENAATDQVNVIRLDDPRYDEKTTTYAGSKLEYAKQRWSPSPRAPGETFTVNGVRKKVVVEDFEPDPDDVPLYGTRYPLK